jgi:hypothetical protein
MKTPTTVAVRIVFYKPPHPVDTPRQLGSTELMVMSGICLEAIGMKSHFKMLEGWKYYWR